MGGKTELTVILDTLNVGQKHSTLPLAHECVSEQVSEQVSAAERASDVNSTLTSWCEGVLNHCGAEVPVILSASHSAFAIVKQIGLYFHVIQSHLS